ncbi:MAG: prepilin-type N-terminal cleavage/methylation domain-containing protein [Oscillospiraceae bacterium]
MFKTTLKKLRSKKGFTLMEMLIVVAIIAVLIAIAIPTFGNSLKKANLAADNANFRTAQAVAAVAVMDDADGTVTAGKFNATEGIFDAVVGNAYEAKETDANTATKHVKGATINMNEAGVVSWSKTA